MLPTIYMVVIIAVLDLTRVFRLSRAGMNIVVMDFFEVAKLRGENLAYLVLGKSANAYAPLLSEPACLLLCLPDNCRAVLPRDWYPAATG